MRSNSAALARQPAGAPLVEAQRWTEERPNHLNPAEQRFIQASIDLRERGRAALKRDRVLFDTLGGAIGGGLGGLVGGIIDLLVVGVGSGQGVIGIAVGSGIFGAMAGGTIALGIGLGSVLGAHRSIQGIAGGTIAGTVPGALLGWLYGQGSDLDPLRNSVSGAMLGALYGGSIAVSVVTGRRLGKWERIVVRAQDRPHVSQLVLGHPDPHHPADLLIALK